LTRNACPGPILPDVKLNSFGEAAPNKVANIFSLLLQDMQQGRPGEQRREKGI
jgi:hypothetical protein